MTKEELVKMMKEIEDDKQKAEKEEKEVSDVAAKIAANLGDVIAKAIENAGGSKKEAKDFGAEFFSKESGLKGIRYPELKDLSSLSKDDKILVWFKSMMNRDKDIQASQVFKALTETDAQGGYMVPEELRSEIYRILPNVAVMRKIALILPMSTDTLNLTTLDARPYAYWTGEYQSKTTTSAEFGRVSLTPNDLVCLLPVTHQLINDANINVVNLLIQLFAEAIAAEEDKAFFTGSGTGRPKGISQETLGSVNAANNFNWEHVAGVMDLAPQRVRQSPNAAFVAHSRVISIMRKLKDDTGRYIWEPSVQVGLPERVYGRPIYEQNDLPQTELYFGDWKFYAIGDRQQITVTTTDVGGDAWRRNATEVKAVERVDGKTIKTGAFKKVTNIK